MLIVLLSIFAWAAVAAAAFGPHLIREWSAARQAPTMIFYVCTFDATLSKVNDFPCNVKSSGLLLHCAFSQRVYVCGKLEQSQWKWFFIAAAAP
jgi:hypothetical protein